MRRVDVEEQGKRTGDVRSIVAVINFYSLAAYAIAFGFEWERIGEGDETFSRCCPRFLLPKSRRVIANNAIVRNTPFVLALVHQKC